MAVLASQNSGVWTSDCIQSAWLHLDPALAEDTSLPARRAAVRSNLKPALRSGESRGGVMSGPPQLICGFKSSSGEQEQEEAV